MMKKLLAMILAVCAMLMLVACGNSNNEEPDPKDEPQDNPPAAKLIMATNAAFPPYEYYDGDKIVGIDAEIAELIAKKLGMELEIVDTEFDSIITGVQTKKYDIGMAGMTVSDERKEKVNFTDSYATGYQVIIVKKDSPITTPDDLFGDKMYKIGVQTGTTGDLYSTWDVEDKGLGTVERYNKGADAVLGLVSNKVDCVVIDNEPAKKFVETQSGLKILDTAYAIEDYAICYGKDNQELGDKINAALLDLIADGSVKKIIDKYING